MSSFWTITTYYNPENYQNRLHNFHRFRTHLNSKLLVVEHSVDGRFALTPNDADILIQVTGGDVLWHKERLLNIAVDNLPNDAEYVAWVDCDVVFDNENWQQTAQSLLQNYPIIQLYSEVVHLPRDMNETHIKNFQIVGGTSFSKLVEIGISPRNAIELLRDLKGRVANPGMAWAAKREVITYHRFYDRMILGAGDFAFCSAVFGEYDNFLDSRLGYGKFRHDYRAWAEAIFNSVSGKIGCMNGRVFHLWHGELSNRLYQNRYDILVEYDFSPLEDLEEVESGVWRLKDHKRDLAEAISDYFKGRREDG